jgi:D-alanyl-lipoteichoic acid acyltransferase DltB (MBOAT superfamily)
MSIVAFGFFCFTAVTVLLYYCLPLRLRWYVPLVASVASFVIGCGWALSLGMCAMAMTAYVGACCVERSNTNKRLRFVPVIAVASLAGVLIILKDNQFFVETGNWLLGFSNRKFRISAPNWVAPLGISYWTLMLIGYLLDVIWGKYPAERNPLKVLLFTCYFPQMTLGPITRFNEMQGRLFEGHRFDYVSFCFGLQRVGWGLFKKLVLSERLALLANTIFGPNSDGGSYSGLLIVFGGISYILQLYTDFSGAIDIVNGISQLFGIILPENFRQPFLSLSLSEIWRRWHLTLGLWVRDYVMYPVQRSLTMRWGRVARRRFGKRRGKDLMLYIAMLATWFTTGFWHGGNWKYICATGLFFFAMIVGGMLLKPLFDDLKNLFRINARSWSWRFWQRTRSFMLFTISVSMARASSLANGFVYWGKAFKWNPWVLFDQSLFKIGLDGKDSWVLAVGLVILLVVSISQSRRGSTRVWLTRQNIVFRWAMLMGLCFAVLILGMYGEGYNPSDFIYGGF